MANMIPSSANLIFNSISQMMVQCINTNGCCALVYHSEMNFTLYALLLCCVFSVANGNLALTRLSFEFPRVPNLSGNQAFLGLFIMFKLIALTIIIGLYPVVKSAILMPAPRPARSIRGSYFTLDSKQIGDILDNIYAADEDGCVARVFCELGALPTKQLTLSQRAILHFVRFMPKWIPTDNDDPRYQLMMAAALGSHGDSCMGLGSTCPYDLRYLVASLS